MHLNIYDIERRYLEKIVLGQWTPAKEYLNIWIDDAIRHNNLKAADILLSNAGAPDELTFKERLAFVQLLA